MLTHRTLAIAAVVLAASLPVGAGAQTDTEAERDEVQERRAEVTEEIDVLAASEAEIDAALDELDAALAAQQAAVAEAEAAAAQTATEEKEAASALRQARRDVAVLEQAIAEMAVASYIHPPSVDLVQSLQAASLSDALLQKAYLDARARRDLNLLDLLEQAEAQAEVRAAELVEARVAAEEALAAATSELARLGEEQARQQAFADELQGRIDARLAEAAVLAELDAELAAEIEAEQAALIQRIPPPTPQPVVPTEAPPSAPPPTTTPGTGGGNGPTTTTTPPSSPPPSSVPTPPLRTVQGITVHADIADDLDAMLDAASADGIELSGWGYRSTQQQIELRRQNCGPTYYDIWIRPASTCNPPTAVPGRSMHEQGRAIDFTYGGRVISTRSSPAFQWLAQHAASYGFYNLPSEPWHWSTNGS